MLIQGRGEAGVLLEEFPEVGVADAQVLSQVLDGQFAFQFLADAQAGFADHLHMRLVLVELDAALLCIHHADEVIDDAGQDLLGIGRLFECGAQRGLIKFDDAGGIAQMVDGLLR